MKKTILRRISCFLVVGLSLLFGSVALAASRMPASVLNVRDSAVLIRVKIDGGSVGGSGFPIGISEPIEYIVTNHHVIADNIGSIVIYSGNYMTTTATIAVDLPNADLCVLKLDSPIYDMPPLPLYTGDSADLVGEHVYAFGFPGTADETFMQNGSIPQDVTITDGIISAVKPINTAYGTVPVSALQNNVATNHGNSGGPLVNERGVVVGVHTLGAGGDANMKGAINISELLPVLDQKNIPYKSGSDFAFSGLFWIILIAAAAAAVVTVLLLLRKRKRRNRIFKPTGTPLADFAVQHGGILSYDAALYTLLPILQQVSLLEKQGRPCLCIDPQNIIVQPPDGRAFLNTGGKPTLVSGYSAPEQYRQDGLIGPWTDVYQTGAVFYRLLTGNFLPDVMARYEDDSAVQAALDALPLSAARVDLLRKSIALKAAERFPDTLSLMEAMGVAQIPPIAQPVSVSAAAPQAFPGTGFAYEPPKPKSNRKRMNKKAKRILIIVVCAALAAAAFGIFYGIKLYDRNNAVTWLEQYRFREAQQILSHVPDFVGEDTAQLKALASAGVLYQQGDYEGALTAFEDLGDFSYARDMAEKIQIIKQFTHAANLIGAGNIKDGQAAFDALRKGASPEVKKEITYLQATAYYKAGYYDEAIALYKELGDYKDSVTICKTIITQQAAQLINEKQFLAAYRLLEPYKEDSTTQEVIDALIPYLYQQGIEYFNTNDYRAKECFTATGDYEDSEEYLKLSTTTDVFVLLPYISNPGVAERVYSESMMYDYLTGDWSGDGHYFKLHKLDDGSYETFYSIPWVDVDDFFELADGIMYLSDESGNRHECYTFTFIEPNYMEVYSHKDGYTYRLTRQ